MPGTSPSAAQVSLERRIVWAEDDAQDRTFIQASLAEAAHPGVTLVPDGEFLLRALAQWRPDLVVMDLDMPGLGGIETLRRIRAHPEWRSIPVVVFSSDERPQDLAQCKALGVVEVVPKPVDFALFSSAVLTIVRLATAGPAQAPGTPLSRNVADA